jgi:hypothetical protein
MSLAGYKVMKRVTISGQVLAWRNMGDEKTGAREVIG